MTPTPGPALRAILPGILAALGAGTSGALPQQEGGQGGSAARGEAARPGTLVAGAGAQGRRLDFRTDRPTPAKVALLVGIDEYAPGTPETFPRLSGCVRDVDLVARLLSERFGFPPEDVLLLRNSEATHENIVRAFEQWLVRRAGEGTEALFWFSGHGSRVPDRSGAVAAEQGRKDSTYVAWDSRARGENGAWDVSDDEIRSLLYALTRRTRRVTVVTDSCHSGGGTRGAPDPVLPRYRSADEGARPVDRERLSATAWPADIPLLDDGDPRAAEPSSYVHIAACSPIQLAQEIDAEGPDGRPQSHGALTFFLTRCLEAAQPRVSYRRIAEETAVRLSSRLPGQTVWYEGEISRELFGASFEDRPAGFLSRCKGDLDVEIDAGSIHGLRPDSIVRIQDGETLVGRARVARTTSTTATARWCEPAPAAIPPGALRAIEESRPAREEPLPVHVADPGLAALLSRSERARIEADPRAAEYAVRLQPDGRIALIAPGDLRIHEGPGGEAGVAKLEDAFREELRYRALFRLAEERGSLQVAARFVSPRAEDFAAYEEGGRYVRRLDARPSAPAIGAGAAAGAEYQALGTLDPGNELALAILEVENTSSRPLHVSVISVAEDRSRNVVFPAPGQNDRQLEPGEKLPIPVNVVAHPRWSAERPMRDRYLVMATAEPADFTPLARESPLRGAGDRKRAMPELVALALEKPATRGVKAASTDRSWWGITTVDLLVSPATRR